MAVGTSEQINNLKQSKNLSSHKTFFNSTQKQYTQKSTFCEQKPSAESQQNAKTIENSFPSGQANLTMMLNNFIENLAIRLPERSSTNIISKTCSSNINNGKYLRPTSELLEELQSALTVKPSKSTKSFISQFPFSSQNQFIETQSPPETTPKQKLFHITIEIERALYLSLIAIQSSMKTEDINAIPSQNDNPSTYCAFEAIPISNNDIDQTQKFSAFTTNLAENSSSPQWNESFDVFFPDDYLVDVSVFYLFV